LPLTVRIHFIENPKLTREQRENLVFATKTSQARIDYAAFIHRHAPDLADSVIKGAAQSDTTCEISESKNTRKPRLRAPAF